MPIRVSLPRCCCMPVWLRKIVLAQHSTGRCLSIEHVGEHIGNQIKLKRNPPPPSLLPKFKRKKSKAPLVHTWAFHWLHEISIPQHRSLNKLPSPKKEAWFENFNWGAIGNILYDTLGINQKFKIPLPPQPTPPLLKITHPFNAKGKRY
jgi:hypothetical protein